MNGLTTPICNGKTISTEKVLDLIQGELGYNERQQTYDAVAAVLTTLRDRLSAQKANELGSQLPLLVYVIYYEDWAPEKQPAQWNSYEFVNEVCRRFDTDTDNPPEHIIRTVWRTLKKQLQDARVENIVSDLPVDIKYLIEEDTSKRLVL